MIVQLLSKFIAAPNVRYFPISAELRMLKISPQAQWTKEESEYRDCVDLVWVNAANKTIVSIRDEKIVQVIFDLDYYRHTPWHRYKKMKAYLDLYAQGGKWKLLVDNGWGYTFKNATVSYYANYSYAMDIVSFTSNDLVKKARASIS